MTEYLEPDDLLVAMRAVLGATPEVRDLGLLASAAHRPATSWYGEEIYADLDAKAAALLLSLVGNHPLVDGNKRLGWLGVRLFYIMNDQDLRAPHDDAYGLVVAIDAGDLDDVTQVADILTRWRR